MIIYGWKETVIGGGNISGVACTECNKTNTLRAIVFGRYAYLYWVPFFGVGKSAVTECEHCLHTVRPKAMPTTYKSRVNEIKSIDL